ncbi:hypothetical protein LIER_01833 [Lithospermum erythrorhizon]|uniref:AT-hook motif nuclear-localized protein n=1 Tax=Lithospermum erythrorhizon TaxID=34254 RepID=A0AAV3NS33_LITER
MDSDHQNHHLLQFQHHPPPPPPPQNNYHRHQQQQPPQHMMVPNTNSYPTPTPTPTPPPQSTITTTMMSPQHHQHQFQHQPQQMQATQNAQNAQNVNSSSNLSGFPFNSSAMGPTNVEFSNGSGTSPKASSLSIEQPKKKRGRPRKYSPEGGNMGLVVSPSSVVVGGNGGDYSGGGNAVSSDPGAKRSRGRPPGSGKKQLDALAGATGVGFTPHVISVKAGEDIASKIMAFAQQGPRTVCILSATGSICNVTLRQAAMSGGNVTYEGRFEIISLAGSFHPSENHSRTGGLSVSLAGSDGKVVGGSVAGMLMAASPIQVIVGSFISDFKKPKGKLPSAEPSSNILNFGTPAAGVASSPSQGASSESSEENRDSPLNNGPGPYNNATQPMQNMSMYSSIGWQNSSIKMPPN